MWFKRATTHSSGGNVTAQEQQEFLEFVNKSGWDSDMKIRAYSTVRWFTYTVHSSFCLILVPRGHDPFGQHQGLTALPGSNTGSPRFTGSLSNLVKLPERTIQNEYSAHAQKISSGQRSRLLVLTKRIMGVRMLFPQKASQPVTIVSKKNLN